MTAKHLIHIGYPKAGSTFLQAWFEQHPELCYAPGGLGGFYNIYEICRPSGRACKYFVTSFEGIATPHESAGDFRLDFARQDFSPGRSRKSRKQFVQHCAASTPKAASSS
jgi:hypothetical protein